MKVVLFCGGMGTRLKDYSERIPKPLVEVGARPILWHLMKYYAHYGHKDFILCLGHGAAAIKDFFLKYDQSVSSDFVLSQGGRKIDLLDRDIQDWRITFVDTGLHSSVGERLHYVKDYLEGDEYFMANYADALCDLDLNAYIDNFRKRNKTAAFLSVPAPHTFHIVHTDADQHAVKLELVTQSAHVRINGGFFVFKREMFEYLSPGEELVHEPFTRLMASKQLLAIPHDGFWRNMDTLRDKMQLDELLTHGRGPWQVWQKR
jgi:glucose-1-phosphate cytidylyltransferase